MKVLVYTSLFPSSMRPNFGIFIKQRMAHFAKLPGCDIRVVAPVPYCPPVPVPGMWFPYSRIPISETIDGIKVYHPRYPLFPKIGMPLHAFGMFIATLPVVRRLRCRFAFDLIDGHFVYPDGLAAQLIAHAVGVPVVLSARGSDIHQFIHFRSIRPQIRFALKRASHVISVCEALKQEMKTLGIEDKKISVIPNGIDTQRFYIIGTNKARKILSIPSSGKMILAVGNLIPLKGFHLIIDALTSIREKYRNVHLYIVGEGSYRTALEKQVVSLGLERHVTFVGVVPHAELILWYNAADVFCLASAREGWANVIMESLACGTPVVATRVYGAPEIITSPQAGVLVERTPESLLRGLLFALEQEWASEQIRSVVSSRTWHHVAKEVRNIFFKTCF